MGWGTGVGREDWEGSRAIGPEVRARSSAEYATNWFSNITET